MPVWPTCFWSCWPMPAEAFIRLPAARTPMSFIVTPPSASAPRAASAARSTVSLSGCLPNLVMWIPRIQMSDAMSVPLHGPEAEPDRLGALAVGADREGGQLDLHAQADVVGRRLDVEDVDPHARAVAVHDGGDEGHGDARRGHRHDGERAHLALGRHLDGAELLAAAARAGVAAVEVAGAAPGALLGFEVRAVAQHQVVHQRDLFGHAAP